MFEKKIVIVEEAARSKWIKENPPGTTIESGENIAVTKSGRVYDDPSDAYVAVKDINGKEGVTGVWIALSSKKV